MRDTVYSQIKWGVHVHGPDTVLAAKSFEEAVTQAKKINDDIIQHITKYHIEPDLRPESCPIYWATVMPWASISSGPHDPEETNWDEPC